MARKGEKLMSTGFGESTPTSTAAPEEVQAHIENSHTGIPARIHWTVRGVPVNEIPDGHAITYAMTDQALAEAARRRQEKIDEGWPEEIVNQPRLKRTDMPEPLRKLADSTDPDDKAVAAMADFMLDNEFDPSVFSANPLDVKAAKVIKPGMSPFWGHQREADMDRLRGFRPVLDDKGQPIKHADLTLLARPEKIKDMELAYHRRQNQEQIAAITQADEKETDKHFREDLGLTSAPPSLQGIPLGLGEDSSTFG